MVNQEGDFAEADYRWSPSDGDEIGAGIRELRFTDAREMLLALHPFNGLFGDPDGWAYRGHADGRTWQLLPSFHRDEVWRKLTGGDSFLPSEHSEETRQGVEKVLARKLVNAIDAAGLPVPGGLSRVRNLIGTTTHFAAQPNTADQLVVWALDARFLRQQDIAIAPMLKVGATARADNANLHAQAGMFTFYQRCPDKLATLDEVLSHALSSSWKQHRDRCVMRKVVLAAEQRTRLLGLLAIDGVSGIAMFPGYTGPARRVIEEVWCARVQGSWLHDNDPFGNSDELQSEQADQEKNDS